jgi:hypothetical protein
MYLPVQSTAEGLSAMELTSGLIFDLGVATGLICVMLAAVVTSRRRRPYTHQGFIAAMDRICDGVQELWAVLHEDEAETRSCYAGCRPDALAGRDSKALRATCDRVLRDILRSTCYIVDRAEPCCRADLRRELERVEINRCAGEVVRQGLGLILYVRWARLRLALQPDAVQSCRQTLKAAAKYTCLWMAVVAFLEAKVPDFTEKVAHAG